MSRFSKNSTVAAELSDVQVAAIGQLVMGRRAVDVAGGLGIVPETISRWRRDPAFVAELNRQRTAAAEAVSDGIRDAQLQALGVLVDAMGSADRLVAVRAAVAVLDIVGKAPLLQQPGPISERAVNRDFYREDL